MLLILCYYSDEYSLINLINHGVFVCHQSDVINYNKNGASVCWLSVFNFQTNKLTQLVNYATITIFFVKLLQDVLNETCNETFSYFYDATYSFVSCT